MTKSLTTFIGKIFAAEAKSPAVHGALRALQSAVVATLVAAVAALH